VIIGEDTGILQGPVSAHESELSTSDECVWLEIGDIETLLELLSVNVLCQCLFDMHRFFAKTVGCIVLGHFDTGDSEIPKTVAAALITDHLDRYQDEAVSGRES
jgi:hypothetical protein